MANIFYVEDDKNLSIVVKDCLVDAGHDVDHFDKGDIALESFDLKPYDICLMDVMLPNVDGYQVVKQIRIKNQHIPIIFISAKTQIEDKLEGLSLGGDDYIFKPFSIEEVLLKVNIFLKRKNTIESQSQPAKLKAASLTLDKENLFLMSPAEEVRLTLREADLIEYFFKNQNRLCKREEILIALWGKDDYFLGRSLDVFISKIRKYFSVDSNIVLENVPRVGFRLINKSDQ